MSNEQGLRVLADLFATVKARGVLSAHAPEERGIHTRLGCLCSQKAGEEVRALVDENAAAMRACEERVADLLDDSDQAVPVHHFV